jgi:hypothetical protein
MTMQDMIPRYLYGAGARHIAVTGSRDSAAAPHENRRNRGHGVPVTPDERALSSWSFLNQALFNRTFHASFSKFCP